MTDIAIQNLQATDRKVPLSLLGWWMTLVAGLVFVMVIVGGVTRLTDSGLSIVEWAPVSGALPPMTEQAWQVEFDAYRQFPEYQKVNKGMSLDEFKFIFWWEWAHRQLGRFIGAVLLVPFLVLFFTRRLDRKWARRSFGLGCLVGVQGGIGWWMVASGLVDRPDVSQYRLATHLLVATFIFMFATRWAMELFAEARSKAVTAGAVPGRGLMRGFIAIVLFQFFLGGLVAGLDAGYAHQTWPDMDGQFIPDGIWDEDLGLLNLTENITTVQFDHRMLAYGICLFTMALFWICRFTAAHRKFWLNMLGLAVLGQVVLGILTIVLEMPLVLAAMHQGGALVVLVMAMRLQFSLRTDH